MTLKKKTLPAVTGKQYQGQHQGGRDIRAALMPGGAGLVLLHGFHNPDPARR
jgi:hypothetical protein